MNNYTQRIARPGMLLFLLICDATAAPELTRACAAPPLPAPKGPVVRVATENQLQFAIRQLTSGSTVILEPGTYKLTGTLGINSGVRDVTIRGKTDSCDDVVLVGMGMRNEHYGPVPHGFWLANVQKITIANLTVKEFYYHPIQLEPSAGAQAPRFYNLHLIDAGQQFIKSSSNPGGVGVNDGIVEYCTFEFTGTARSSYTGGVDVLQGANWIVRHNLFKNIRAPAGQLAGPAILMWQGSKNSVIEGNLLLNVQYGIALGLDPVTTVDHTGGIVRNNFIHRTSAQSGDVGITINNSAGTQVLHNTVILNGTYPHAIEYRFPASKGLEIRYNLCDARIQERDGGQAVVADNVTHAQAAWFKNAAAGDLHLSASASAAIDRARQHPDATTDYDGDKRPAGSAPDIGADERGS